MATLASLLQQHHALRVDRHEHLLPLGERLHRGAAHHDHLIAGQVTMVFADPISALAHVQAGTLRALAVTSKERSAVAPDVPTIAESGYPGFDAIGWHGILAPAKTPPAIVKKLNDEIVKALQDPDTKALLEKQAMQTVGDTPEAFAAFIGQDIAIWKEVATQANVEVK